jgi:hypothetical protein
MININKMYCVKITKSYPNYKSSYDCQIEYFSNIEEANEYRKKEKRNYYEPFLKKTGISIPKNIDELDEDMVYPYIYSKHSMINSPFEATLYEVSFDIPISSKIIDLPKSNSFLKDFETFNFVDNQSEIIYMEDNFEISNSMNFNFFTIY